MGRERSAFHPGPESFHSNEGRIHERRPTLSLSFFACDSAADHTWKDTPSLGYNRVFTLRKDLPSSRFLNQDLKTVGQIIQPFALTGERPGA